MADVIFGAVIGFIWGCIISSWWTWARYRAAEKLCDDIALQHTMIDRRIERMVSAVEAFREGDFKTVDRLLDKDRHDA